MTEQGNRPLAEETSRPRAARMIAAALSTPAGADTARVRCHEPGETVPCHHRTAQPPGRPRDRALRRRDAAGRGKDDLPVWRLLRISRELEGYEHLILDAMLGDQSLFTTAGAERLWENSTPLLESLRSSPTRPNHGDRAPSTRSPRPTPGISPSRTEPAPVRRTPHHYQDHPRPRPGAQHDPPRSTRSSAGGLGRNRFARRLRVQTTPATARTASSRPAAATPTSPRTCVAALYVEART